MPISLGLLCQELQRPVCAFGSQVRTRVHLSIVVAVAQYSNVSIDSIVVCRLVILHLPVITAIPGLVAHLEHFYELESIVSNRDYSKCKRISCEGLQHGHACVIRILALTSIPDALPNQFQYRSYVNEHTSFDGSANMGGGGSNITHEVRGRWMARRCNSAPNKRETRARGVTPCVLRVFILVPASASFLIT